MCIKENVSVSCGFKVSYYNEPKSNIQTFIITSWHKIENRRLAPQQDLDRKTLLESPRLLR